MNKKYLLIFGTAIMMTALLTAATYGSITALNIFYGGEGGNSGQNNNRAIVSEEYVSVSVCAGGGCDYTTIQDAVNEVPLILRHKYLINIHDGAYNEEVFIPLIMTGDIINATEGSVGALEIVGNDSNHNGVSVDSFHVSGAYGAAGLYLRKMMISGSDSRSDEDCGICVYGSKHPIIGNINFTGSAGSSGIVAYGSDLTVSNIDCGDNDLARCLWTKHGGTIRLRNGNIEGSATTAIYSSFGGGMIYFENDETTGTKYECDSGLIYGMDTRTLYCIKNITATTAGINNLDLYTQTNVSSISFESTINDVPLMKFKSNSGGCVSGYNGLYTSASELYWCKNGASYKITS